MNLYFSILWHPDSMPTGETGYGGKSSASHGYLPQERHEISEIPSQEHSLLCRKVFGCGGERVGSPALSQEQKDSSELKAEHVTPVGDISLSPLSASQAHRQLLWNGRNKPSRICLVEQHKKINVFIPKISCPAGHSIFLNHYDKWWNCHKQTEPPKTI